MVSSYLVPEQLGLIDTVWAVILPGAASTLPVFIMTRFFMDIPGGGHGGGSRGWGFLISDFLRFGLPLGAPGILSAVVLGFLEYWNAIEAPQAFLKNQALWPLSLYMSNITADNAGVSLIASLITLMPPLFDIPVRAEISGAGHYIFRNERLTQGINIWKTGILQAICR